MELTLPSGKNSRKTCTAVWEQDRDKISAISHFKLVAVLQTSILLHPWNEVSVWNKQLVSTIHNRCSWSTGKWTSLLPEGLQSPDWHTKHRQAIRNLGPASNVNKAARSTKNIAIPFASLPERSEETITIQTPSVPPACWVFCWHTLQVEGQSLGHTVHREQSPRPWPGAGGTLQCGQRGAASPEAAEPRSATPHIPSQSQTCLPPPPPSLSPSLQQQSSSSWEAWRIPQEERVADDKSSGDTISCAQWCCCDLCAWPPLPDKH